jgi:hypothetical protein
MKSNILTPDQYKEERCVEQSFVVRDKLCAGVKEAYTDPGNRVAYKSEIQNRKDPARTNKQTPLVNFSV